MTTEPEHEDIGQDESSTGFRTPGSLLKAARERHGFSEKSIADQLHITMHYVRAIETDQYEKLPGTVFAKGYIKSYATLLQLDENEIIRLYEEYSAIREADSPPIARRKKLHKRKQIDKDSLLPWLLFAIFAFIAGFVSLWVYNTFLAGSEPAGVSAAFQVNPIEKRENVVVTAVTGKLDLNRSTLPAVRQSVQQISADEAPHPIDYGITDPAAAGVERDNQAQDSGSLENDTDPGRLVEVFNVGNDKLHISFTGISWIELKDSGSERVYRDIHEPGDRLQITGTAPFSILLGDAPFATIRLNDVIIDIEEYLRIDNSARLVVGL